MEAIMRLFRCIGVTMLVSLALAGCGKGETVTAQQIMDGLKQTREKTDNAHAVVEVVTTGTQQDGRFVVEAWIRKSSQTDAAGKPIVQSHLKVLDASKAAMKGAELVNDGETLWLY